jgi:hypothetical protein
VRPVAAAGDRHVQRGVHGIGREVQREDETLALGGRRGGAAPVVAAASGEGDEQHGEEREADHGG